MGTGIPYVDEVWNVVTGCTPASPGCDHCYAEAVANRFWGKRKFSDIQCHEDRLNKPLHWRKPRKVLTCSMGDIFHEKVPFEFIDKVFFQISFCPQHSFMLLTKRPKIAQNYLKQLYEGLDKFHKGKKFQWPFKNVHLGVTICNQAEADEKIPILLSIPAAHHWFSAEPLLGPIDATRIGGDQFGWGRIDALAGLRYMRANALEEGSEWETEKENKINQAIIGCESGPNRRPCKREWIESLVEQCRAAGVKYMVKQMEIDGKVCHDLERIKEELGD